MRRSHRRSGSLRRQGIRRQFSGGFRRSHRLRIAGFGSRCFRRFQRKEGRAGGLLGAFPSIPLIAEGDCASAYHGRNCQRKKNRAETPHPIGAVFPGIIQICFLRHLSVSFPHATAKRECSGTKTRSVRHAAGIPGHDLYHIITLYIILYMNRRRISILYAHFLLFLRKGFSSPKRSIEPM